MGNELTELARKLQMDPTVIRAAPKSTKLVRLLELINELFTSNNNGSYRGIVFVERVALVSSLAKQMNDVLAPRDIRCGAVAGTGLQNQSDLQNQLESSKTVSCRFLSPLQR